MLIWRKKFEVLIKLKPFFENNSSYRRFEPQSTSRKVPKKKACSNTQDTLDPHQSHGSPPRTRQKSNIGWVDLQSHLFLLMVAALTVETWLLLSLLQLALGLRRSPKKGDDTGVTTGGACLKGKNSSMAETLATATPPRGTPRTHSSWTIGLKTQLKSRVLAFRVT